jgi:uncharacterized membrane protein YgdD (TMEM256/DUF423 family)
VSLTEIKAAKPMSRIMAATTQDGARSMPTEIILITFIALGFCVFAGTLYWADLQTRGRSG